MSLFFEKESILVFSLFIWKKYESIEFLKWATGGMTRVVSKEKDEQKIIRIFLALLRHQKLIFP